VTKDSCGRYFISFVVDTEPDLLPEVDTEVGIDLGLTTFAAARALPGRGRCRGDGHRSRTGLTG
jgi:transposase